MTDINFNTDFTHWILVVPHPEGEYRDPEGRKVNIHRFPKDRSVATKQQLHKGTTIAEFVDNNGYERLRRDHLIPSDTPFYEELSADDRFSMAERLLENKAELTDINGIGPAYAEDVVEHITAFLNNLNQND